MSYPVNLVKVITPIAFAISLAACGGGDSFGSKSLDSGGSLNIPDNGEKDVTQNNVVSIDLQADALQLLSDGVTPVNITAIAKDKSNIAVTSAVIEFSVDGNATLKIKDNVATLTSGGAVAGDQLLVTATIALSTGNNIIKTVLINVVETLQVGKADSLEFTASSRQVFSAGVNPVVLSAIVKDINNNTISNEVVTFQVDSGATITDNNSAGVVKTANLTPGSKENRSLNVTATVGSIIKTIQVNVIGTNLSVEGPDSIAINKPTEYIFKLQDSADNAIAFTDVSISSDLGSVTPTLGKTDANGELIVSLDSNAGGTANISAVALNANASKSVNISGNDFTLKGTDLNGDGSIDINDVELDLGVLESITMQWLVNGNPMANEVISIRSTRGTLNVAEVTTSPAGIATFNVTSDTAGSATITAETSTGLTAILNREFVATTPAYLNAQASPSLIAPSKSSTIVTKVRDANDNPVKNVKVNFNLTDAVNGQLSNAQAVTDSLGRAEIIYTAGDDSSAFEGVKISTYLQDYTAISDNVVLTVGGKALRIVLGNDHLVGTDEVFYKKTFGVIVTDSAGNPIKDQAISFTITPTGYQKGLMYTVDTDGDGKADKWEQYVATYCPSEDFDNDGNLDVGEDINKNGALDPTHDAAVTVSGVTDDQGKLIVEVVYPKSRALWSIQRITSSVVVNGTEFVENTEFVLPIAAGDVLDPKKIVPNYISPYGVSVNCDDNTGIITDDIVHSVVVAGLNLPVSSLRKNTWYTVLFTGAHGQPILSGSSFDITSNDLANIVVEKGPNNSFKITDMDPLVNNSGFKVRLDTTHAGGTQQSELLFYGD